MSNPYDLEAIHRGGNIAGSSGQLFKPMPNAADKAYEHDLAAARREGEQRGKEAGIRLCLEWLLDESDERHGHGDIGAVEIRAWLESRIVHWPHHPRWPRAQQAAQEQE